MQQNKNMLNMVEIKKKKKMGMYNLKRNSLRMSMVNENVKRNNAVTR